VNGSHIDSLLHALQGHTEKEDSCDLQIHRQVYKDLAQSRDLGNILFLSGLVPSLIIFEAWWRRCESTCLLQVLDSIEDVS
jgi:hypothetical protein